MTRQGYTKIPNHVFQDKRLDGDRLALLCRLASYAPGFIVITKVETRALRVCEDTYRTLLRDLRNWGYIETKVARPKGKVAGLFVTVNWPGLTPKSGVSETTPDERSDTPETGLGKRGPIKKDQIEERDEEPQTSQKKWGAGQHWTVGRQDAEPIDYGDVVEVYHGSERDNG